MYRYLIIIALCCGGCATTGSYKAVAYCDPHASSHIHVGGSMQAPTLWTTYDTVCFDSNGMVSSRSK